jgi:predicted component of type VI protein secretion system
MPLILAVRNHSGDAAPPLRIERGEVVVGRGAGAHLLLASPSVSRRHCAISGEGATWRIVDSSSGGTFVNGARIAGPQFLRHGDVIRVGEVEIAAMLDQAAPASAASSAPAASPSESWGRPAAGGSDAIAGLLQAAGLARGQVGGSDPQVAAVAGAVLRAALAGLVRLAQDRHKARTDLGITAGDASGALGSPEEWLARLLSLAPAEAARQVGALGAEIDTHQRAVLGALQGSLHHALDQFSPASIKTAARGDAEAWKAYERAFDAQDGFVEVFAQALSRHYGEAVRGPGPGVTQA